MIAFLSGHKKDWLRKITKFFIVFFIIFSWVFTAFPIAWRYNEVQFPPKIKETLAGQNSTSTAAANIIAIWPYASSTIPGGWYRYEPLDTYFVQMVSATTTSPGSTGGSTTHNHTSPSHNHTQDAHQHTGNSATGPAGSAITKHTAGGDNLLSTDSHTHTVPNSSSNVATNQAAAASISTETGLPPYREVLWIYSDGSRPIPHGAIAFSASSTIPSGWVATTTGLFYRGASASSNPAYASNQYTTFGSDTHTHTSSHNHTQDSHGHTSTVTGDDTPANDLGTSNPANSATQHAHGVTYTNSTATNQAGDGNVQATSSWPSHYGLVAMQNNTQAYETATGSIAIWVASPGMEKLPPDWYYADGSNGTPDLRGFFINATSTANVGQSKNGGNGHAHTATDHTHTQDSHSHSITIGNSILAAQKRTNNNSGPSGADYVHSHSNSGSAVATPTNQNTTMTVDANSDTRPPYFQVAFIVYRPAQHSQSAYRWYNNNDSTDVGTPLADQNTSATLASAGAEFRLRVLIHTTESSTTPQQAFTLQLAEKGGASSCDQVAGSSYATVTPSTVLAYKNNAGATDGAALTANANDPTSGYTIKNQTYVESSNASTTATTSPDQDLKFDFSLVDNSAPSDTSYCLRVAQADADALRAYPVYPEVRTTAGNPALTQRAYRWRNDNGSEAGATYAADENTALSSGVYSGDRIRIRISISNATAPANNYQYGIAYSTAQSGPWTIVSSTSTSPYHWVMDASTNLATSTGNGEGSSTFDLVGLSNPGGKTFTSGQVRHQMSTTTAISLSSSEFTELEYSIKSTANIAVGTPYYFRITNNGDASVFVYSQYPTITVSASAARPIGGGSGSEGGGGGSQQGGGTNPGGGSDAESGGGGNQQGGGTNPGGGGGAQE